MHKTSIVSWNTKKLNNGFQFKVSTFGYNVESVILKEGICKTRAVAINRAKKWTKYFKSQSNECNSFNEYTTKKLNIFKQALKGIEISIEDFEKKLDLFCSDNIDKWRDEYNNLYSQ